MNPAIADPEERFASLVRAGTGAVDLAGRAVPVHLAALHAGSLVLGVAGDAATGTLDPAAGAFGIPGDTADTSATADTGDTAATASGHPGGPTCRAVLYDVIGGDELGPAAPALLAPPVSGRGAHCGRDCPSGCSAAQARGAVSMVRQFAEINGTPEFLDPLVEHTLALELAEHTPHPALLAVGAGIRLLRITPVTVDVVDHHGCARVDPVDLELAEPDPFCDIEAVWLARLNDPRSDVIKRMVHHLQRRTGRRRLDLSGVPGPVAAVALDRFGVTLGARDATGARRQWRIGFARDCSGIEDLARELRALCGEDECGPTGGSLLRGREA